MINSIREFNPDKKLLVVFQPHLFSRTKDFADWFRRKVCPKQMSCCCWIFTQRENYKKIFSEITSEWLLEKVNLQNKEVSTLASAFDKIKSKDFDVLLTVGAGNIDTLYDGIVEWLENR